MSHPIRILALGAVSALCGWILLHATVERLPWSAAALLEPGALQAEQSSEVLDRTLDERLAIARLDEAAGAAFDEGALREQRELLEAIAKVGRQVEAAGAIERIEAQAASEQGVADVAAGGRSLLMINPLAVVLVLLGVGLMALAAWRLLLDRAAPPGQRRAALVAATLCVCLATCEAPAGVMGAHAVYQGVSVSLTMSVLEDMGADLDALSAAADMSGAASAPAVSAGCEALRLAVEESGDDCEALVSGLEGLARRGVSLELRSLSQEQARACARPLDAILMMCHDTPGLGPALQALE